MAAGDRDDGAVVHRFLAQGFVRGRRRRSSPAVGGAVARWCAVFARLADRKGEMARLRGMWVPCCPGETRPPGVPGPLPLRWPAARGHKCGNGPSRSSDWSISAWRSRSQASGRDTSSSPGTAGGCRDPRAAVGAAVRTAPRGSSPTVPIGRTPWRSTAPMLTAGRRRAGTIGATSCDGLTTSVRRGGRTLPQWKT